MSNKMRPLLRECGPNPGALLALLIVRSQQVQSIPPAVEGIVAGNIVLAPGIAWVRWDFKPGTASFLERGEDGPHGMKFSQRLDVTLPRDRPLMVDEFNQLRQGRFVLLALDQHLQWWLVGTIGAPARQVHDSVIEGQSTGDHGLKVVFSAESILKVPVYTGKLVPKKSVSFVISRAGNLIADNTAEPATTAVINDAGELVISGTDNDLYSMNERGEVLYVGE